MWDIKSVILYLVMASIGYFCISEERRSIQNGVRRRLKVSYAILFLCGFSSLYTDMLDMRAA